MIPPEELIKQQLSIKDQEKTYIDKVLGRKDSERIRVLVMKKSLKREELLELLYLLVGTSSKLVNFDEWDRYVINKFFIWIREYVKITEFFFDYKERLEKSIKEGNKERKEISKHAKQDLKNCELMLEHNAKYLVDVYLNISNTSLSVGATALTTILSQKYEVDYSQKQQQEKKGILGIKR